MSKGSSFHPPRPRTPPDLGFDIPERDLIDERAAQRARITIIPSITAPAHKGVVCDCCGATRLHGMRYKCNVCPNYDLCQGCFPNADWHGHDSEHAFTVTRVPRMQAFHAWCGTE